MPQPAMHLLLAGQALDRWRRAAGAAPPFPLDDLPARNAFLHGSLGPDMGLFPGADPLVSWHVHRDGGSDVARRLVASDDPILRAFGWGWVTHVISDALIHPLINEGGAALLRDLGLIDDGAAPPAELHLVAHIRVELGIEGWYAGRADALRRTRLRHVFHRASVGPLVDILREAYDVPFDTRSLLAAHRGVTPFAAACVTLARLLATDLQQRRAPRTAARDFLRLPGVRRVASSLVETTSPAYAFLNPVRPAGWLLHRVDAVCHAFFDDLDACVAGGLGTLPNFDLNTGARLAIDRARVGVGRSPASCPGGG